MSAIKSPFARCAFALFACLSLLPGAVRAQPSLLDPTLTQVSAGEHHTCALTTGGGVTCWGNNDYGQLGDGSITPSPVPVNVSGLASGAVAIAAGHAHTCALTTAGGVKCWGRNNDGQLGVGTKDESHVPVGVSGLASGAAAIAAGSSHTCAVTAAGAVKCWGQNANGQLGNDSVSESLVPAGVTGLASGMAAVVAGESHTCALTTAGGVKCWGANASGQLGNESNAESHTPVNVSGLASGVTGVSSGDQHACALVAGGGVKCWGLNGNGQLGDDSTTNRSAPVDAAGLASGVSALAAGGFHTCAINAAGGAVCWGLNLHGQVGDDSFTERHTFAAVSLLGTGVVGLAAGAQHSCALVSGGTVECWGHNSDGQLGDRLTLDRPTPVEVSGFSGGVVAITSSYVHTCALSTQGGVKCWGRNAEGQLGDNTTTFRTTPVDVAGLTSGVIAVSAGGYHTCALTSGGGVKCWGWNSNGEVGDGTTTQRNAPVDVTGLSSGVTAVSSGVAFSCALMSGGAVKCWGYNAVGQLGDNSSTDRHAPVDVVGPGGVGLLAGATALATGGSTTFARMGNGGVKSWGGNQWGQLGIGTADISVHSAPVDVKGTGSVGLLADVTTLETGGNFSCAVISGGGLKCWGWNGSGELGDNTTTQRNAPIDTKATGGVGLLAGVTGVAAGGGTCALISGGGVKCWGSNTNGEVGDNTVTTRYLPVDVKGPGAVGLLTGVAAIVKGGSHSCALTNGGGVQCWGIGGYTGDGTWTGYRTPTPVLRRPQAIAFSPPVRLGAGTPASATGTATYGLAVTYDTWTPGNCTITAAGAITPTALGLCGLRASQAGDGTNAPAPQQLRVIPVLPAQTITFAALPNKTFGNPPFTVSATASSALAVVFTTTTPTVCSVAADTVALLKGGTCTIVASQPGDASFGPAAPVTRSFTVNKAAQAISFAPLPNRPLSASPFTVSATASSGLPVTFGSSYPAVCATSGTYGETVTLLTMGDCLIWANQNGDDRYLSAPPVWWTFTVTGETQTIIFPALADKVFGDAPFTVSATGGGSGNPVVFTSLTTPVCTATGTNGTTVTIVAAGTCTIGANQAGNAIYSAAPQVNRSFLVAKAAQAITFGVLGDRTLGDAPFGVSATGGASGNPVTFSSLTGPVCTTGGTNGATVTLVAAGGCTIAANQAASANFEAAPPVTRSFTVAPPACDVGAPGDCDGDGIPNAVEIAEGRNPLAKDNDVFASNRLFAMQQYRDFLGREGDAGGVTFYTDLLTSGAAVRANVIESFFNSPEFSGTASPIVRLYFATFLRIPDFGGLQFQVDAYRTGTPLTVVANNFTLAPEFQTRYGALTDPQYVALLYQNVLNRTPVQAEVDYHVARLATGVTRGEVMTGFSESPEYQGGTFNDVYVTMMYVGMLGRAPEQAGYEYWVTYMDTGNPGINLILGFLNAPEYHNRFLP